MRKILFLLLASIFVASQLNAQAPTWSGEIACIVYNKCSTCHNPEGVAPFSLMSYDEAYSFRASIKSVTSDRIMPPWGAKRGLVDYVNDLSLTEEQINLIAEWVDNDAPEGDPGMAPEPPVFDNSEGIADPDVVVQFPDYTSNAVDEDDYRCFVEPWTPTQWNWVVGTEVVPGNTNIVHHTLFSWDPSDTAVGLDAADPGPGYYCFGDNGSPGSFGIGGWAPGAGASVFPEGFGFQLPPGGNIIMQTHFPEGSAGQSDATKINFKFSDQPNLRPIGGGPLLNHVTSLTNGPLFIPANTVKTIYAQETVTQDLTMLEINPHLHLIGTSIKSYAVTPAGDTLHFIDIPNWDFDWQFSYGFKNPIVVPQGSIVYGEAVYDNTSNNPLNPSDPPVDVSVGEATTDEMFLLYFTWTEYQPGDEDLYIEDAPPLVDCGQIVGTSEPAIGQLVRIFPNPATDQVRLSFDGDISGELQLYDSTGKLARDFGNIFLPADISVKGLAGGLYFLKFKNGQENFNKRIIVIGDW